MGLLDWFSNQEGLIAVDIGSSSVKLVEIDLEGQKPRLLHALSNPLPADIFNNNMISKPEVVAEQLANLIESAGIQDKRVVVSVPGPSVFTKRIKMPKSEQQELAEAIQLEAGNFIPHNIDAVKLDYQVLGTFGKNQVDVLVVAVKNEIIESFLDTIALAGLETGIVDVDYFALQNIYELTRPDLIPQTTALINVGARYSTINICKNGESLFTGDISVGGNYLSEAVADGMNVSAAEANKLVRSLTQGAASAEQAKAQDIVLKSVEYVAAEINRQLSFLWNASGADEGIERIMVGGGASGAYGLIKELGEKTGVSCELLDPLHGIEIADTVDQAQLALIRPALSIAMGLGIREPGDKLVPEV